LRVVRMRCTITSNAHQRISTTVFLSEAGRSASGSCSPHHAVQAQGFGRSTLSMT
jgi:hypothetical protein